METPYQNHLPADFKVPEEALRQLHEANEAFHRGREHLEASLDSYEPDRKRRLDLSRAKLQDAERQVEEVTGRIHEKLE